MRFTTDVNFLIRAALHPKGLASAILILGTQAQHVLVLSPTLLNDVRRVLHYDHIQKRYGLSDADIDDFVKFLEGVSDTVLQPVIVPVVLTDPDDDVVLATAVDGQAEIIGTLDKHFADPAVVAYCTTHGIRILNDIDLIRELRGSSAPNAGAP